MSAGKIQRVSDHQPCQHNAGGEHGGEFLAGARADIVTGVTSWRKDRLGTDEGGDGVQEALLPGFNLTAASDRITPCRAHMSGPHRWPGFWTIVTCVSALVLIPLIVRHPISSENPFPASHGRENTMNDSGLRCSQWAIVRKTCLWELALSLAAALAGIQVVHAEISYKIPGDFGWRAGVPLELFEDEAVLSDLSLDAKAAHALAGWKAQIMTEVEAEASSNPDPAKRLEIRRSVLERRKQELDEILSPAHQSRLYELHLQKAGLNGLSDSAVADSLGLSPEQRRQVLAIHQLMFSQEKTAVKTGRTTGHLTMAARDEKLFDILSDVQKETFDRLKGRPFDSSGCLQWLRLDGRDLPMWNVAFSPDGRTLASTHHDQILLWQIARGERLFTLKGHKADITSIAFSPDGKWLVSASVDRTIRSWDATNGQNLHTIGMRGGVRSIALSSDGQELWHAYGSELWNFYRYSPYRNPLAGGGMASPGLGDPVPVWSVACSRTGRLQSCGRQDGSVCFLHILQGRSPRKLPGHAGAVLCVTFSADGGKLASGGADGIVKLWDSRTEQELLVLKGHVKVVRCVAFHPDGRLLASAGEDGTVRLWDLIVGAETRTFARHAHPVTSVAFSPDGNRLASVGGDNIVRVWELPSGNELLSLSP